MLEGREDGSDRGGARRQESASRAESDFAIIWEGTKLSVSRNQSYPFGRDACFEGMDF